MTERSASLILPAAIYHRTSSANAGSAPEKTVAELRRYVELRGWPLALERVDHHPRHDGPRPGLESVSEAVASGEVRVVVIAGLAVAFRTIRQLVEMVQEWRNAGATLVALREQLDGTDPACRGILACIGMLHGFERELRSEATRVGIIRARLQAAGDPLHGWRKRTLVPINKLEIKALYESGVPGRPWLSQRQIVIQIKRTGGRISKGALTDVLREMREAGELDEKKRAKSLVKIGGRKGGRPKKRLRYDADEILALQAKGLGPTGILRNARSLGIRATVGDVRRILAELGG